MTRMFSFLGRVARRVPRGVIELGQGAPPCCHGPGRGKIP